MDSDEGSQFSAPINSSVIGPNTMIDDLQRVIASWDDGDLIEQDAIRDTITTPTIEAGRSSELQEYQGLNNANMAPLAASSEDSCLRELNPLQDCLFSNDDTWDLGFLHDHDGLPQDIIPVETNDFQNSLDGLEVGESAAPSLQSNPQDHHHPVDDVLQTYFDLYHPEPEPPELLPHGHESQSYNIPNPVWSEFLRGPLFQSTLQCPVEIHEVEGKNIYTEGDHRAVGSHSLVIPTVCNICGLACNPIDRVVTTCGHVFCLSCLSGWLQNDAKPCPECSTLLSMDANVMTTCANYLDMETDERNNYEESKGIDLHEFECAPELMQGYYHAAQNYDCIGTQEYQPVQTQVWQPESDSLNYGFFPNEVAVAESGPLDAAIASTSKESEQQFSRKRGREPKTLVVDHNGVAMRFDGVEERFTAYYRPSYWTEDDSAVFLGEYPTFEEAKDAHNLVALLHEGPHAQMDLSPFTADRYAEELKRWESKHHVDLVCELRLRGRGYLQDGSVNYKHVGRRRTTKNTNKTRTRYFSTVLNDQNQSSNIATQTAKPKRTYLQTFDTPEQAARYADQALVKQKGVHAWTNFPLTSYITSEDDLPLTFLPLSNNFRENLAYKRARNF